MGAITSSNVANAIVKLVAVDALPVLVGNLVMGNLVNRDYEPVLAHAGDTVNVPIPGVNSRVEALEVPLLRVTPVTAFRLVLPLPVQLVLLAPVKVMATCEVFAF